MLSEVMRRQNRERIRRRCLLRRSRAWLVPGVAAVVLVGSACEEISIGSPDTTVTSVEPPISVSGDGCNYGGELHPALSAGIGPVSVTYDLTTGEPSISVNFARWAFGPLTVAIDAGVSRTAPGCFTVVLIDRERGIQHLVPIEGPGEHLRLRGAGRFEEVVRAGSVEIDVTELCELWVFSDTQPIPPMSRQCPGAGPSYWTVQLGSLTNAADAATEAARLTGLGISEVQVYDASQWAVICPGYWVLWSRSFSTFDEAERYRLSLPEGPVGPFTRLASNDPASRPTTCVP